MLARKQDGRIAFRSGCSWIAQELLEDATPGEGDGGGAGMAELAHIGESVSMVLLRLIRKAQYELKVRKP
jgi:hypothetical protein